MRRNSSRLTVERRKREKQFCAFSARASWRIGVGVIRHVTTIVEQWADHASLIRPDGLPLTCRPGSDLAISYITPRDSHVPSLSLSRARPPAM